MLNVCLKSKRNLNFTGRINAFRVIEHLEKMNVLILNLQIIFIILSFDMNEVSYFLV